MIVKLLPSSHAGPAAQYLTTLLVNGELAIDAGCLGWALSVEEQARVGDVFLTHSHLDHVAALPIFLENVYGLVPRPPRVHASADVWHCLRTDVFNDRLFPDFLRLSRPGSEFLEPIELSADAVTRVGGVTVRPIAVNHAVPTVAYLIDDGRAAIALVTDTGATEAIWEVLNSTSSLRGVFLDVSFPDSLAELAARTGHLTPRGFAAEVAKLRPKVPVYAIHLKAPHAAEIVAALATRAGPDVTVAVPGHEYRF